MIIVLVLLAALCAFVALRGGLKNIARDRKYKSGTGWCYWRCCYWCCCFAHKFKM
jgi:hypothetical protein